MPEAQRHLHLYFPENDLALARDLANFTPPPPALQMRLCGQCLPMWYGEDGDAFMDFGIDERWFAATSEAFGLRVSTMPADIHGYAPMPWGWSRASRKFFSDAGMPVEILPDDIRLAKLRCLSSRRTAAMLGKAMSSALPFNTTEEPHIFEDTDALMRYVASKPQGCIVKTPWSNAGRGNIDTTATPLAEVARRSADAIKRYGMVSAEPRHDRVADFAMLWTARADGTVAYDGLSLFETTQAGAYTANILTTDNDIRARLGRYIPEAQLDTVASAMAKELERLIGGIYHGPLGVDMLVARTDGGYVLDPVVEVNMRRTMGHVAHAVTRRHLAPGSTGRMYVTSPAVTGTQWLAPSGCEIDGQGRMRRGRVDMAPPTGRFRYVFEARPAR